MTRTYSTGSFAAVVAAGGRERYMNLGRAAGGRHESTRRRQTRMAQSIAEVVAPQDGDAILDIGCGRGGMLALLADEAPGARLTGVNVDPIQLQAARRMLGTQRSVRLLQADARELPFARADFDTAYAVELLSHLDHKQSFYQELARVIRPGGRAVLAVITLVRPFVDSPPADQAHLRRLGAFFAEDSSGIPTAADLLEGLAAAGLTPIADVDLTSAVFPARQETFIRINRHLGHHSRWHRRAARAYVRRAWGVEPDELHEFIGANLTADPCRLYEYHLFSARKANDRSSDVDVAA